MGASSHEAARFQGTRLILNLLYIVVAYFVLFFCCAGGQERPVVQFGGGILASLGASIIDVPVEVIRQRQMVQTASEGSYTVRSQPGGLRFVGESVDRG